MNMPQQLNVSYNFNGFLVCQIPKEVIEVELKIKTKWGKYTLLKDFHTRMEKYRPWDRGSHWVRIHSRKRTPHHQKVVGNTISTDSGTYIPNGKGIGYPPKVFIDPKDAATDTENDSEADPLQIPFLGNYCMMCILKWSASKVQTGMQTQ